jgi:CDP-6-deoxy-D-xylo-4-hexulose-3-dehydrase
MLIEDTCESMGSEYHGQKLGTFGEMSTFSMYFGHHISTIEGGMVYNITLHRLEVYNGTGWVGIATTP